MSEIEPKLPQWWTPEIEASWTRSRAAAVSAWLAHGGRAPRIDGSDASDAPDASDGAIEVHALAFGHGARSAYPTCTTWETARPRLQTDWTRLGYVGTAAWDKVADIVRSEWSRAGGPGGDAPPEDVR